MQKQTKLNDDAAIYQPRKEQKEKEKLKDMSFREKISYLWEYYRLHGFAVIITVIFVIYLFNTVLTPKPDLIFQAAIVNNPIPTELLDNYEITFGEYINMDEETENVRLNYQFYFNGPPDYAMNMRQALATFVMAQEIDVIIAPESEFNGYAEAGFSSRLSEQLPTDLYSALTDHFYMSAIEEDADEEVFGIYVTDTKLFKENAFHNEPYILGIAANSKNKANAIEFIRFLFQIYP